MDYEDFLAEIFTPLKSIEVLTDVIYEKCNDDWRIFSQMNREHGEELLAINYAINLCAKNLLQKRVEETTNLIN